MRFFFFLILISNYTFAQLNCQRHFISASQTYKSFAETSSIFKVKQALRKPDLPTVITKSNEKQYLEKLSDYYEEIYMHRLQFHDLMPTDDAAKELIEHSNYLVSKLQNILAFKQIPHSVDVKLIEGTGLQSYHINLVGKYIDSNDSFEILSKFKQALKTRNVTVDPLDNIILHTHGFSDSVNRRVEIGVRSLIEQLIFDEVQVTTRHEFLHASYILKRKKGVRSIYNHSFSSFGRKPLSPNSKYYNRYMSNEEIYTFSNNPFWASDKFAHPRNYSMVDIIQDFDNVGKYLKMNQEIFTQSRELAEESVQYLQDIIARAQDGTLASIFPYQGKNHKKVLHHLEAQYMLLDFGDGRVANVFLDDMKKEYFRKIYDVFENLSNETVTETTRLNQQNFKVNYLILLKNIEEDFQKMVDLSKILEMKNETLLRKYDALDIKNTMAKDVKESGYFDIMEKDLKRFRKDLRKMGVMSREDYKGFMMLGPDDIQ